VKPNFDRPEDDDGKHWDAVEEAVELLHEERYREALLELRGVLQKDPQNPYAFYFLGVALYESGELEAARDAYRACVRLAPKHLGAKVALTHVLRALGDLRDAIRIGTEAYQQAPGDSDVLYALGHAYWARGDKVAARRYFEAFLKSKPEFEVSVEVRGILDAMDKNLS
jgi:cytochrome c-type biogenesis protein CcmH/NrfG